MYLSFGGLLMSITGKQKDLKELEMDARIYLLIKEIWIKNLQIMGWEISKLTITEILESFE